jgi:hypothetical protein
MMTGMSRKKFISLARLRAAGLGAAVIALAACATALPPAARGPEQVFPGPQQAVDALVGATRADDEAALLRILGPDGDKLVSSGDSVADRRGREKFLAAYDRAHEIQGEGGNRDVLVIGDVAWPLPIPLVRVAGGWQFDTAAGAQEILNRRIGRNELTVLDICREFIHAQREYAAQHPLSRGRAEYAQRFVSSKGRHDGLYWPVTAGQKESPFGPLIAHAEAEGYKVGKRRGHHEHKPFFGYYYRILKRQGPGAVDGARDYVVKGHMSRGFAMLAWPAKYGDSGVMTFIVNDDGIVYEKNLGPGTAVAAANIKQFDPDKSWKIAQ